MFKELLHTTITFVFDRAGKLLLKVEVSWRNQPVSLSMSSWLPFLFQNESELSAADHAFGLGLTKLLKKVVQGNAFFYAITDDFDMVTFFKTAIKYEVNIRWRHTGKPRPLAFDGPIPIQIQVQKNHQTVTCSMANRDEFIKNPLSWIHFQSGDDLFCFSNGVIMINPASPLVQFISEFHDKPTQTFRSHQAFHFIKSIYEPYKNDLHWKIPADLFSLMPTEDPPTPVLTLSLQNGILSPALAYQYGTQRISPDETESIILERDAGRLFSRSREMETIYQSDLMTLFFEYKLPFMLENPGDIATFLTKVVPILKSRDWIIESNIDTFTVVDTPINLSFSVEQKEDWFYFAPNTDCLDQSISLQEIARLMVENHGYIKTKRGFVKISDQSQQELKLLTEFGALRTGKKFSKPEILPLLGLTQVSSPQPSTQELIHQLTHFSSDSIVPTDQFKGTLRDYQLFGLRWLRFLKTGGFGGILADDMGLGKTVQTLAFCDSIEKNGPTLIVGPTNVLYNWEREIRNFTPHLRPLVYTGSQRSLDIANVDFVVTSFGILKNDIDLFAKIPFSVVLIDEAQFIKNPKTQISAAVKQLSGQFRLALTGTPIENHLQDLWNLFDFAMPGYLGTLSAFDALLDDNPNLLKNKIRPFVLRREKREVLSSLPPKTEMIIECEMTPLQTQLYQKILSTAKQGVMTAKGKVARLNILTALLKLRQVCSHPGLLAELEGHPGNDSGKWQIIQEKILELIDNGHKIVLFSQFTKMLDIIETWVVAEGIETMRIDGSVTGPNRQKRINQFQESPNPGIFLISLKAGGVGINLTAADYVIHVDPWWNPATESQATDRVHRMGQKNKVMVYKFVTRGTIEEKIVSLQQSKRELLEKIVDIDNQDPGKLDWEEIKNLIVSP